MHNTTPAPDALNQ